VLHVFMQAVEQATLARTAYASSLPKTAWELARAEDWLAAHQGR
jgi:hypothetical protein